MLPLLRRNDRAIALRLSVAVFLPVEGGLAMIAPHHVGLYSTQAP
jgi:hypothetical protein